MLEKDWAYLRASLDELQEYILSDEVYWPLIALPKNHGTGPLPSLTLGRLLLARARLLAAEWQPEQQQTLDNLCGVVSDVKKQWRAHWVRKATQEFPRRLSLWQHYLRELKEDPKKWERDYVYQVERRVMLQLLMAEMDRPNQEDLSVLSALDHQLMGMVSESAFLWDPRVENGFPQRDYWFLYYSVRSD
ncbi:MAG TPA: hypothetical protein PLS77_06815 [Anaerolineaceae bacterium]|nr:hypothetical protein [Longilinea sp.]NMD31895.1 hypothetical protein [Chloroflexota bacterium]HNZ00519.1 hypothetical protein [Anaerolineaceae bacterium]HOD43794.1 hypothetical protein [Anaerolineaceae bacterium]HOH19821.1 hypothetical protein [Anaerolineaceae bacterium]